MTDDESPVLPWAAPPAQEAPKEEKMLNKDLVREKGLALGTARIQVHWMVGPEDDDEEETEENTSYQWWGATLQSLAEDGETKITDGEGRVAYILRYDAWPELGYDQHEDRVVTFLDDHELFDIEEVAVLHWRMAGDSWEPSAEKLGVKTAMKIDEWLEHDDKMERLAGVNSDQAFERAFQELPPDLQREALHRYNDFAEILGEEMTEMLKRARNGSDGDITIKMEHVEELKKRLGERVASKKSQGN